MESYSCEKWKLLVTQKPKLRFYKEFKNVKEFEPYVKFNLSSVERSYIAQLRLGILPIAIETERYRGTPANDRLC